MVNDVEKWMKLSRKWILAIFIYDIVLLIIGMIISIKIIVFDQPNPSCDVLSIALVGSIGMCLVGSSIYYIRKIYKSCIQNAISSPNDNEKDKLQMIGTIVYFIIRPIFGVAFVLLFVIGLKAGILSMATKGDKVSQGYVYVCMFASFFIGFSNGKFLSTLQKKSDTIINNILKSSNKGVEE